MSELAPNEYQRGLGYGGDLRHRFRFASSPIERLVRLGSVVRTSYGTGPYIVAEISMFEYRPPEGGWFPHWSFVVQRIAPDGAIVWGDRGRGWLNEIVPHGRRLLALFENNDDEVFVIGFRADALQQLAPRPERAVQLDLFGVAA
jgi:hypothetical protein